MQQTVSTIAVIPARGGSKGLPGKNVRPLGGKPLIAHTIEAALAARHVGRTIVTTDDAEIAAVARRFGAEVVQRPAELASDTASSESALLHVLDVLEANNEPLPEVLVFLQCTSPLTMPEDVDGLVDTLLREGADSAFTGTPFFHFLWQADETGDCHGINHQRGERQMRQDRPLQYLETGAGYAMRTAGFREQRHRFFGRVACHEVPGDRTGEIDTLEEFRTMEARLASRRQTSAAGALPAPLSAIAFDFDGVLTDDRVFVSDDGAETVACSRRDGMGVEQLRAAGIPMIVLSKEVNPVVKARCDKLRLEAVHGLEAKGEVLAAWAERAGVDLAQAIFVGNDVNDLECFAMVGCAVAPRDAHPAALAAADVVLDADGGRGAVRLLADLILSRGRDTA